MSGYDLKKHFDTSVAHFWSATQSHIYKSMEKLDKEGMEPVREASLIQRTLPPLAPPDR